MNVVSLLAYRGRYEVNRQVLTWEIQLKANII